MGAPKWFDKDYYLNSKLDQMHEIGYTSMTKMQLKDAFKAAGYDPNSADSLYDHFVKYGNKENVSPDKYFDPDYYFQSKAADYYKVDVTQVTDDQVKAMKDAFAKAGLSAWDHYTKYGMNEEIDPNANFSTYQYLADKLALMQAQDPSYTMEQLKAAFKAVNLNAVSHYFSYGQNEGLTVTVATSHGGPAQALTTGIDNLVGTTSIDDDGHNIDDNGNLVPDDNYSDYFTAEVGTLQSEDTVNGLGGSDTLVARVNATGAAGELEPTITDVETVLFQSQIGAGSTPNNAAPVSAYIDADRITLSDNNTYGLTIGSDNSRADLTVEDISHNSSDTTIRFANADPEVSFHAYFDPQNLKAKDAVETGMLVLRLMDVVGADPDTPAGSPAVQPLLTSPYDGFKFTYKGATTIKLQFRSEDVNLYSGANANYETLLQAFQHALDDFEASMPAMAGIFHVKLGTDFTSKATVDAIEYEGTGTTIVLSSDNGKIDADSWLISTGETPASSRYVTEADPDTDESCPLIQVTVELDNVGRVQWGDANPQCLPDDMLKGSNAGDLQIGSMSMRSGIERMDVKVDEGSWLAGLYSTNDTLRMVTVEGKDINGDSIIGNLKALTNQENGTPGQLYIGTWEGKLDLEGNGDTNLTWADRAQFLTANKDDNTGLNDVAVFDATDKGQNVYAGDINIAANITDASYDKYLKHVDGSWEINDHFAPNAGYDGAFAYLTGSGDDTLNMKVAGDIASDVDFKLVMETGAGEDLVGFRFDDLSDNQSSNQKYMKNVSVDTGADNDTVWFYADSPEAGAAALALQSFSIVSDTGALVTYVRDVTDPAAPKYVNKDNDQDEYQPDPDAGKPSYQTIYENAEQYNAVIGPDPAAAAEPSNDGGLVINTGAGVDRVYANQVDLMEGGMTGAVLAPDNYNAVYAFNFAQGSDPTISIDGFNGATLNNDVKTGPAQFALANGLADAGAKAIWAEVTFKGITQTIKVLDYNNKLVNVSATDLNHGIIDAINQENSVLEGLLSAKDGAGNSLLIESKINGKMEADDLTVNFYAVDKDGKIEAFDTTAELFAGTTAADRYATSFAKDGEGNDFEGKDDLTHNQVVVDAGAGDDLIVLGKNFAVDGAAAGENGATEGATDVVVLSKNFGNDTIFDFSGGNDGTDKIDVHSLFSDNPGKLEAADVVDTLTAAEADQIALGDAVTEASGADDGVFTQTKIDELVEAGTIAMAGAEKGDQSVMLLLANDYATSKVYTAILLTESGSATVKDTATVMGSMSFEADVVLVAANIDLTGESPLVPDPA